MTDWIRWKRGKGTRCKRGRAIMHFVGAAAAAGNEAWSQQTCEQRLGSPNAPARACAIACVQVVGGLPSFWIQISNIWNLHLVSSMPPHLLFPDTVFRFFQITRNTLKFPTEDSSTAARFWKLEQDFSWIFLKYTCAGIRNNPLFHVSRFFTLNLGCELRWSFKKPDFGFEESKTWVWNLGDPHKKFKFYLRSFQQ